MADNDSNGTIRPMALWLIPAIIIVVIAPSLPGPEWIHLTVQGIAIAAMIWVLFTILRQRGKRASEKN